MEPTSRFELETSSLPRKCCSLTTSQRTLRIGEQRFRPDPAVLELFLTTAFGWAEMASLGPCEGSTNGLIWPNPLSVQRRRRPAGTAAWTWILAVEQTMRRLAINASDRRFCELSDRPSLWRKGSSRKHLKAHVIRDRAPREVERPTSGGRQVNDGWQLIPVRSLTANVDGRCCRTREVRRDVGDPDVLDHPQDLVGAPVAADPSSN
jgi:hypothetical protein